jgi:hypothetical protein
MVFQTTLYYSRLHYSVFLGSCNFLGTRKNKEGVKTKKIDKLSVLMKFIALSEKMIYKEAQGSFRSGQVP